MRTWFMEEEKGLKRKMAVSYPNVVGTLASKESHIFMCSLNYRLHEAHEPEGSNEGNHNTKSLAHLQGKNTNSQ